MLYEPLYTFRLISAVVAPIQDLLACFRITTEPEICRQWRNRERGSERLTEMSPISLLQVVKDIRWDIDLYPIRALLRVFAFNSRDFHSCDASPVLRVCYPLDFLEQIFDVL